MSSLLGSNVNENEKKNLKNFKTKMEILKKKQNGLEMWLRRSCPQNVAWIHAAVSEKPEFTDDGRTDGRWTPAPRQ